MSIKMNEQTTKIGERIALGDLPRTPYKPNSGVQQALIKVYNYCRQYPNKMASFKTLLMFMVGKIQEWEKLQEVGSYNKPTLHVDPQRVRVSDTDGLLPHTLPEKPELETDYVSEVAQPAQVQLTRVRTAPNPLSKAPDTTTSVPTELPKLEVPTELPTLPVNLPVE